MILLTIFRKYNGNICFFVFFDFRDTCFLKAKIRVYFNHITMIFFGYFF